MWSPNPTQKLRDAQRFTGIKVLIFSFWLSTSGLTLPDAWVLLQTGRYDFLILLAVDGACGVHQALQVGEPEGVVKAPQLEGGQGGQTSLILLLVSRGVVPEAHHTWTPHTDYRYYILILIYFSICTLLFWFLIRVLEESRWIMSLLWNADKVLQYILPKINMNMRSEFVTCKQVSDKVLFAHLLLRL